MTVSRIVQLVHVGGIGLPSIDDPCHFLGPIQGLWRRRRCYARDGGQGGHYWDAFDRPKVMYQDIAWNPRFCLDTAGTLSNNTVYFLSTDDAWTLAALNASRRAAAGSVDVGSCPAASGPRGAYGSERSRKGRSWRGNGSRSGRGTPSSVRPVKRRHLTPRPMVRGHDPNNARTSRCRPT